MAESSVDYYETYYSEFLEQTKRREGNVWLEFAMWLLHRFGCGTITNPTTEGLVAWNTFYKQMCDKNMWGMDVLLVRADDNVQRRSLVEPVMERNEGYDLYKAGMIKKREAASAHKRNMATVYKGFLGENNIHCIGAEDRDFMTQREWMASEERRIKREKWLVDNKDRFVIEAFEALDTAVLKWREKYTRAIVEGRESADTWDLAIPEAKKEKAELAKKLKGEWRFKDAVSGLSVAALDILLREKITEHKAGLMRRVVEYEKRLFNFEHAVELWGQFRILGLDELKMLDTRLRREEKPVLMERTEGAVREYNSKMSVLNVKLKIISKLIQMNTRGVRCMDEYRGCVEGIGDYFEF